VPSRARAPRQSARPAAPVSSAAVEAGDDVLVARLSAGDDEAIGEVFDRYASFVFGLARRVTAIRALAEDVVQEVFTALWCHPDRFDAARGSLRAFLGVLTHRRAVDAVRSDARRAAREERHGALEAGEASAGQDNIEAAALVDIVRKAIARLPVDQRRAVELAYIGGHTHRELASLLGIPEGTAKSRLRLAQAKLGEWLGPQVLEMA
jgi:RNA polymerase sigma-70 factor (ECF subfamily)